MKKEQDYLELGDRAARGLSFENGMFGFPTWLLISREDGGDF